ncbi:MAG: hypothetical protein ABI947_10935 [Chloroflexota bacterium]
MAGSTKNPFTALTQRGIWPIASLILLVALIVLFAVDPLVGYLPDSRQVIYRYADQLRAGNGLVFNAGERVLLVASPAYMLLLALLSMIPPLTSLAAAKIVFALALAFGAYSLFRLARRAGLNAPAASLVAILFACAPPLFGGIGTAFPLASALCLVSLDLAFSDRWRWAGVVLALATLCSPEAALLVLPLLFLASSKNTTIRYFLAFSLPLAIAFIALRLYYGSDFWNGLLIFKTVLSLNNGFGLGWLPIAGLAIYGWFRQRANPVVAVCGTWAALYVLVMLGLLRNSIDWQYAPIIGSLLLLCVVGLQSAGITFSRTSAAIYATLVAVVVLVAIVLSPRIATPSASTNSGVVLGIMSASDALKVPNQANESFIAFDGQLQPDLKTMIERGDVQSSLIRYAPDVLLTTPTGRIRPTDLRAGAWARLNYQPGSEPNIYVRKAIIGQFVDLPTNFRYGPDIQLTGLAIDQTSLQPGQLLRVRLDWQLSRAASKPVTVDVRLSSGDYLLAHSRDTFEPSIFKVGAWSTYHTLTIIKDAWAGPVSLDAGLIVSEGLVGRNPLTTLEIKTP